MKAALSSAKNDSSKHSNLSESETGITCGKKFPLLTIASVVGMVPDRKVFRGKLEFLHNNKYN